MKKLITLLSLCTMMTAASAQWVESRSIYTNADNPKTPVVAFVNSYSGHGGQAGVWQRIDLKPMGVPADAKAAFLSGVLIITHGAKVVTCDLQLALRGPGSNLDAGNYIGQTIEAKPENGMRSNMSSWVPLVDGAFELMWSRSTYGQWPADCAYGVNLSLQAWTR